MGELSRRVARSFDVWDGVTPFLHYEEGEADHPVTRGQLAAFGAAVCQALIELGLAMEKIAPDKLAGEPIPSDDTHASEDVL
jgi:hypothetical protein